MPEITPVLEGFLGQGNYQRYKQLGHCYFFPPLTFCSLEFRVNHFTETNNGAVDDEKL